MNPFPVRIVSWNVYCVPFWYRLRRAWIAVSEAVIDIKRESDLERFKNVCVCVCV